MSEADFQRARNGNLLDQINYVGSLKLREDIQDANPKKGGTNISIRYIIGDSPLVRYLGRASMAVFPDFWMVHIYSQAFVSDFILTEDDFTSALIDHEFVHLKQEMEGRFIARKPKKGGKYLGNLNLLQLPDNMEEDKMRRDIYSRLHHYAAIEIEAYGNQLKLIAEGKRNCSNKFVEKINQRIEVYRQVM